MDIHALMFFFARECLCLNVIVGFVFLCIMLSRGVECYERSHSLQFIGFTGSGGEGDVWSAQRGDSRVAVKVVKMSALQKEHKRAMLEVGWRFVALIVLDLLTMLVVARVSSLHVNQS